MIVFLKDYIEKKKINFEKKGSRLQQKHEKVPNMQR